MLLREITIVSGIRTLDNPNPCGTTMKYYFMEKTLIYTNKFMSQVLFPEVFNTTQFAFDLNFFVRF